MEYPPTKIKYILYARKSTESEDRQVLSIDSQMNEMKQVAEHNGREVSTVKTEARSAKAPGRLVFNEMLDEIETGKAQGIIVWNPDRLSRNSVDTGRLIYLFDLGKLQEVVTPTQVFRNTPSDKFLLSLLCSQAKLDNDNKGLNVKRGLKAKAERGAYPAPAPLGYVNDKYAEQGHKTIKPDPERFDLVRKMFDLMLTGNYNPPKILKIANEEWGLRMPDGRKLSRSTLYYLFTRPFYYGMFEYPVGSGIWYRGSHKPLITTEEYDRIQVLLGREGKPRPKNHVFAFTGMMRCGECGCVITAEEKVKRQQNGNVHHYVYYHCTKRKDPGCSQKTIEVKRLEQQIQDVLASVEIPPEFHDWALKWFRKENEKEVQDRSATLTSQRRAYDACVRKIDTLIDMRAAGEITEEEFKQKKSRFTQEKMRLQELLNDMDRRVGRWLDTAERVFTFARDARKKFATGDFQIKKTILGTLGSNLILKGKKLTVDLEKSLLQLKNVAREVQKIHERLEPLKMPIPKTEIERLYARSPRILRALDDVRTALQGITGSLAFAFLKM